MCLIFSACEAEPNTSKVDENVEISTADTTCEDIYKKSQAVQNIEMLLAEIPLLSMDKYDEIRIAREKIEAVEAAYNDLSEEEREQVENWRIFEAERARLFENEYQSAALMIQYMNFNTEYVITGNVTIWDNVGGSDFFSYQDFVFIVADLGYEGIKNSYGKEGAGNALLGALKALDVEQYNEFIDKNFMNFYVSYYIPSNIISDTEEKCKSYAQAINNIEDSHATLKEFVDVIVKDYSEEYSTQTDALWKWWIESSLYADHALEPSGYLNSYISAANEYLNNISRYQKTAGY